MTMYVCLLSGATWHGEEYRRGEILCGEHGDAPPGVGFASFEPPPGLSGVPEMLSVSEDPAGLLFEYRVGEEFLTLRGRIGVPMAAVVTHTAAAPEKVEEYPGLATTEARGAVRWVRCTAEPRVDKARDPLRDGFEIDYLRRGM